jgi:hypothetical protein
MSEATHIVLSDMNSFISTYTRKHRQYIIHVQVLKIFFHGWIGNVEYP